VISTTQVRIRYVGDGAATVFPFGFTILSAADLVVVRRDALGTDATLALGVDYSVPAACLGSDSGGSITLLGGPLPVGWSLTIERRVPVLQPADLRSQAAYPAEEIETALDRLTMIAQQTADSLGGGAGTGRVLRLGDADVDGAGAYRARGNRITDLAEPSLATDAATLGVVQRAVLGAITGAEVVLPLVWRATGDGATTSFPLAGATLVESAAYDVQVGGVMQRPDTDYVVHPETQTIRFDAAPPTGVDVVVVCRGYAVPVPQPPWYTTETLPEPSAGMAGKAACVRDDGCAGYEVVCLPDESGAWHWHRRTLAAPIL
jgi:hypothetical protein